MFIWTALRSVVQTDVTVSELVPGKHESVGLGDRLRQQQVVSVWRSASRLSGRAA